MQRTDWRVAEVSNNKLALDINWRYNVPITLGSNRRASGRCEPLVGSTVPQKVNLPYSGTSFSGVRNRRLKMSEHRR